MPASLRLSIASQSLLLVAVLLSAFIFISSAVPYLMLDAKALSKFEGRQAGILVHVFTASVALLLGPVQIWMGQTGRSGPTIDGWGLYTSQASSYRALPHSTWQSRSTGRGDKERDCLPQPVSGYSRSEMR